MKRHFLFSLFLFSAIFGICVTNGAEDVCKLAKDVGRCRAAKPMFYFNMETKRCEGFLYKGCGGNANKFENLEECHEACQHHLGDPEEVDVSVHLRGSHCLEPPISDTGKTCYAYFPRFTFNPDTLQCEPYIYGGCSATSNLFLSEEECRTSCFFGEVTPDQQQQQQQQQQQSQTRTTTPPPTQRPGKKNKSKTTTTTPSPVEDDESSPSSDSEITLSPTLPKDETSSDLCELPPVHPHLISCFAFVEKWTYDSRQGTCVEYFYGGCYGTRNLFDSLEDCQAKCSNPQVRTQPSKTVEVCGLSIDKGPCRTFQLKFAFNRETNRCEKFAYGGCQGNDNRFDSLEDCVNVCGGHEPQENLMCVAATCNFQEAAFHRSKGCQPIVQKGECCPSSWNCGAWEERLRRWDECFWTDEKDPRGRYYAIGDSVPEASEEGACRAACKCVEGPDGEAQITCAEADCSWPGMEKEGTVCHPLYQDPQSCCPSETKCDAELSSLPTCQLDDVTYVYGQKMKPKPDPCKVCLCKEGWKGQTESKDFCYTIDCALGVKASSEMKRGCQPIYKEGVCCPIDWTCPIFDVPYPQLSLDTETESEQPQVSGGMIICPPGVAIRPGAAITANAPPPEEPLGVSEVTEDRPRPVRVASDVCLLPKTLGPCEGFQDAWYFDLELRKCRKFKTGGPGSGGNLFESEEECQKTCSQFAIEASAQCEFSVEKSDEDDDDDVAGSGSVCATEQRRFHFNKKSGKCEDYVTSNCGPEVGGYASMDECEAHCLPQRRQETSKVNGKTDKCNLPPDVGPCRSRLSRFYYDLATGRCKKFWFGGCQGNPNNFGDERECLETCVDDSHLARAVHTQDLEILSACQQPGKVVGPCKASQPRYYFDGLMRTCRLFFYGGCLGNDNNFLTASECVETCPVDKVAQKNRLKICDLPKQAGDCRAFKKSYFYNKATTKCEAFSYSGCGGNENNFETLANCQLECVLPKVLRSEIGQSSGSSGSANADLDGVDSDDGDDDACLLERQVGTCRAAIKRFYFDKAANDCKKFTYGGCGGNSNNFATFKQCRKRCSRHINPQSKKGKNSQDSKGSGGLPTDRVCSLPVEVGPCRALRPAFFYNTQTKRCERFVYGGCKGTANRFVSQEDCESTCYVAKTSKTSKGKTSPIVVPLPSAPAKCNFGGKNYNLGDVLRFENNRCRTCKCLTPPSIACSETSCPVIKFFPTGNSDCEPIYDEDGCCELGYTCKPKHGNPEGGCSKRPCAMIGFIPPPNHNCKSISDGCCQAAMECVPN